jgi:hypothetical protein
MYTPVTGSVDIKPGMVVYFRWASNPASYIQQNLLKEHLPGHPAVVRLVDHLNHNDAPFLLQPIYGKALAKALEADPPARGKLFLAVVSPPSDVASSEGAALGAVTPCAADDKSCSWVMWAAAGVQMTQPSIKATNVRYDATSSASCAIQAW